MATTNAWRDAATGGYVVGAGLLLFLNFEHLTDGDRRVLVSQRQPSHLGKVVEGFHARRSSADDSQASDHRLILRRDTSV